MGPRPDGNGGVEWAASLAMKVPNPFSFLFASSRQEEYLAQYVGREAARGRTLDEILADPYVRNRSTPQQRARVLERPEIVEAVGESAVAEMRQALAGAGGRR
jgi:hypothetical protein